MVQCCVSEVADGIERGVYSVAVSCSYFYELQSTKSVHLCAGTYACSCSGCVSDVHTHALLVPVHIYTYKWVCCGVCVCVCATVPIIVTLQFIYKLHGHKRMYVILGRALLTRHSSI